MRGSIRCLCGVYIRIGVSSCTIAPLPSGNYDLDTELLLCLALSHIDNRYGMTILAYDGQGRIVRQWERMGARYIVSIKLTRDKVEFIGQGGLGITFSLGDLRIS